jgi:hypothetical protein
MTDHRHAMRAFACAFVFLLAGCKPGTPADRINAALPMGSNVIAARQKLSVFQQSAKVDAADFEAAYAQRLEKRATGCAHGFVPGYFDDEAGIAERLDDKECFARADAAIADWLRFRLVGEMLAAPPLRAKPAALRRIDTGAPLRGMLFADDAGVAVAQQDAQYKVIDLGTGAVLATQAIPNAFYATAALSPNGRLLLSGEGEDTLVRDVLTNDVLATIPGVHAWQFHFVANVGAIYAPKRKYKAGEAPDLRPVFLDFRSGEATPIPVTAMELERVLPKHGAPGRYVVFAFNRVSEIALVRGPDGVWRPEVKAEMPLDGLSFDRSVVVANDARQFAVGRSDKLGVFSLDSLQSRIVPLAPMRIGGVIGTPDEDKWLMRGWFVGDDGGPREYVYSIGQRTFAPVDRSRLLGQVLWIPSMKRNALIDGNNLVPLDALPVGAPEDASLVIERGAEEAAASAASRAAAMSRATNDLGDARAAMIARMIRENHMSPDAIARIKQTSGVTDEDLARVGDGTYGSRKTVVTRGALPNTIKGPLLARAQNADIRAIGVYQGSDIGRSGAGARTGTVNVIVRPSARPTVLVLTSYEPVRWVISLQEGAKLAAVVQSSYSPSEVLGAGGAPITNIGLKTAYKRGSPEFVALDEDVAKWTGKRIGGFQGAYTGKMFILGL